MRGPFLSAPRPPLWGSLTSHPPSVHLVQPASHLCSTLFTAKAPLRGAACQAPRPMGDRLPPVACCFSFTSSGRPGRQTPLICAPCRPRKNTSARPFPTGPCSLTLLQVRYVGFPRAAAAAIGGQLNVVKRSPPETLLRGKKYKSSVLATAVCPAGCDCHAAAILKPLRPRPSWSAAPGPTRPSVTFLHHQPVTGASKGPRESPYSLRRRVPAPDPGCCSIRRQSSSRTLLLGGHLDHDPPS
ncbi:hypothetical protein NDU88_004435 [Pleurodeles waltl]|uniref:Uncharacterized protein n=1 Tax=Pleurodeles waltl TaxID=8319 RepID=A0AAV7UH34_PLEWA|nr:hypothetical protein NDU88_004435 [Pleurodeles waltl]